METPLIIISPVLCKCEECYLPDKKFNKVVFPHPEAPRMTTNYPGRTVPEILSRITFSLLIFYLLPLQNIPFFETVLIVTPLNEIYIFLRLDDENVVYRLIYSPNY